MATQKKTVAPVANPQKSVKPLAVGDRVQWIAHGGSKSRKITGKIVSVLQAHTRPSAIKYPDLYRNKKAIMIGRNHVSYVVMDEKDERHYYPITSRLTRAKGSEAGTFPLPAAGKFAHRPMNIDTSPLQSNVSAAVLKRRLKRAMAMHDKHSEVFQKEFRMWLSENYAIYDFFNNVVQDAINLGHTHYAARTVVEIIRHHTPLREASNAEFKINHNMAPDMARLHILQHPHRQGLFQFKVSPVRGTMKQKPAKSQPIKPTPEAKPVVPVKTTNTPKAKGLVKKLPAKAVNTAKALKPIVQEVPPVPHFNHRGNLFV